jgi:putative hydrolase of the HAD superfamily
MPSPTPFKAVIFDFGGTLANIVPTHDWLFVRACRELGLAVDPHRVADAESVGWEPYATPLGPAHVDASASAHAFAAFKTALLADRLTLAGVQASDGLLQAAAARVYELDTDPEMYRLYDDALPLLGALQARGVAMAVLSNHEWDLPSLVSGLGVGHYMASVVTSARVGYRKPHPKMFETVCGELGVAPAEALMVGDSVSADVRGAAGVGMAAVYLQRDGAKPAPDGVSTIRSLTGVLDFV